MARPGQGFGPGDVLKCNVCWKDVVRLGYITRCSHLFCREHAQEHFSKALTCPICASNLPQRNGVVEVDLVRLAGSRSVLYGLSPSQITELAMGAVDFWTFQRGVEMDRVLSKASVAEQRCRTAQDDATRASERMQQLQGELRDAERAVHQSRSQSRALEQRLREQAQQLQSLQETCQQAAREKHALAQLYRSTRAAGASSREVTCEHASAATAASDLPGAVVATTSASAPMIASMQRSPLAHLGRSPRSMSRGELRPRSRGNPVPFSPAPKRSLVLSSGSAPNTGPYAVASPSSLFARFRQARSSGGSEDADHSIESEGPVTPSLSAFRGRSRPMATTSRLPTSGARGARFRPVTPLLQRPRAGSSVASGTLFAAAPRKNREG